MSEVLYDKSVKCPICNNSFSSKRMRSSACRIEKREEDFCVVYKGHNPMHYEILVCPQCGYAASENSFDSLTPTETAKIREILCGKVIGRSFCGERSINDALDSFKLALFIAQARDAKKSTLGGLCLKLAWIYREMKSDKENVFLAHALENYKEAYNVEPLPFGNLDEISIQYLMGELSRRLENFDDAVFWFNKAIMNPERRANPRIEKMARDQWSLAKDQSKKV